MNTAKNHYNLYVLALMAGNILFGLMPALQKLTFPYGGNGLLTAFYSSVLALIPLAFWAKRSHISLVPDQETARKLGILSVGSAGTVLLLWSSYNYIPVGIATTLHYIYPLVIAVIMTVRYHEPFTPRRGAALILVLCGILPVSISGGVRIVPIGILLALTSGFFWAFYIIYMEKSGLCHKPPVLINFCTTLVNIPCTLAACAILGKLGLYQAAWAWLIIAAVAILHRIAAYGLLQLGLRRVPPVPAGILCTFEPVSSLIFGALLFGETLSPRQLLGLFLIFSGIFINMLPDKQSA